MKDFIEKEEFVDLHIEWFKQYLELPCRIASHDRLEKVVAILKPLEFNKSFLKWISKLKKLFSKKCNSNRWKNVMFGHLL